MGRQKNNHHKISIILPVFDESLVLADIKQIQSEFEKLNKNWETICVFDSSLEKSHPKSKLSQLPHVKIFSYPLKRFGKGFALCYGFRQSAGDLIFFWEGNFSVSPKQLCLYLDLMDLVEADVVIGSKRHPLSRVSYSPLRRFYSQIYQLLIKVLFRLHIDDTQVGLKLYKRKVLDKVIPKIIIKNWAFDLEILIVAHTLGFTRIIEAPIEIKKHFIEKQPSPNVIYNLLKDTFAIFYRQYILKYYQQKFV